MRLRKLKIKDAPYMLEWMHDISVVQNMQTDFASKTEDDCRRFITDSWKNNHNYHLAIVDDDDTYQGTVSLKNIQDGSAEFAITVRSSAMGKGFSSNAMKEIVRIGFNEKGLSNIYWFVSPENKRALRFYDKNGYNRVFLNQLENAGIYNSKQVQAYIWYLITKKEKKELQ